MAQPPALPDPCLAHPVAGVDEAGRGPLAGPVVAAAVILPERGWPSGIADSKALSPAARQRLAVAIRACAAVGVGTASVEEIDRLNIHHATLLAMRRAVASLAQPPAHLLVDGIADPDAGVPTTCLPGGDARSLPIAAASIIAKVVRDALMAELDTLHPAYGFARHKGYPVPVHLAALRAHGPCPQHRRSFAPVAALLGR